MSEPIKLKPKLKLKIKNDVMEIKDQPLNNSIFKDQPLNNLPFKEFIFNQIIKSIPGDYNLIENSCLVWSGYKQKHKYYDKACLIVYMKNGRKHFIDPQKYIYNYLKYPELNYGELIRLKNTVRNIDTCQSRGVCCVLSHLEET